MSDVSDNECGKSLQRAVKSQSQSESPSSSRSQSPAKPKSLTSQRQSRRRDKLESRTGKCDIPCAMLRLTQTYTDKKLSDGLYSAVHFVLVYLTTGVDS
jgi:hypothetical protein